MKRRRTLVAGAALVPALAVLALLAYGFGREPRYLESPMLGRPAPPFSLVRFDGLRLRLEDLRGKVVWDLPETFFIGPDGRITSSTLTTEVP